MKKTIIILLLSTTLLVIMNCGVTKQAVDEPDDITEAEKAVFSQTEGDTIHIGSEETEYDIIIIEPGFNTWLLSIARPEGFYSQPYLENRNYIMVTNWNQRVLQPQRYSSSLYEMAKF